MLRGFIGQVKNVPANHRPGRPSCFFSMGPKNTNLVEEVEILLPVKFCSSLFREEVENAKSRNTEGYSKSIVRKNNDKCGKRIGLNKLNLYKS